jgi:peptidoglycan hydrolase-like protein with peptidoglycan-binding domain
VRERQAPAKRKRPSAARSRPVVQESESLLGRLADKVIENPGRAGGFTLIAIAVTAIVSNAAFLQTKHHPDPFFVTRDVAESPVLDIGPTTASVPLPKSRQTATLRLPGASNPSQPLPQAISASSGNAAPVANLVADTQKALADARLYDGAVDGVMGPQTKAAISAFEKKIGLIPTGQPSARLLGQMRKGTPRAQLADPISTGSIDDSAERERMKRVQAALNEIGYGPIETNGHGGGKTATAIRRFELDNGLPLTGAAGDAVIAKLVMIGAMNTL